MERACEWFSTAPHFLDSSLLKSNTDPVFRMQQTVAMVISTLYMTVKPSKPFNPILGETYEGYLSTQQLEADDPCIFKIYAEQTSHHPPVSNFLIENDVVKIFGNYEQ
jgi:hypothetical protein